MKKYKDLSIKTKLWLLISLIVVFLIIGIILVSATLTVDFVKAEVENSLAKNVLFLSEKMDLIYNETATFTKMAISNSEIQEFSLLKREGDFEEEQNIKRILSYFITPRTYIANMNIFYFSDSSYYGYSSNFEAGPNFLKDTDSLNQLLSPTNTEIFGSPFFSANSSQYLVPYYRKIYDGKSGEVLGLIEAQIPLKMFSPTIDTSVFSEKSDLYVIDTKGKIILHHDEDLINTYVDNDKYNFIKKHLNSLAFYNNETFCQTSTVTKTGWIIINEILEHIILAETIKMRRNFIITGFLTLLLALLLFHKLSVSITKPIVEMEKSISTMDNLGSRKYVQVQSNDEIGKLAEQYNNMIDRVAEAAQKERERDVLIKQYELALLQSQINPHFLNNILENICGLIELDRKKDSTSLIKNTADFYRSILSTDNLIISLQQEINTIELYVKIQNVRWHDRINCVISVPEKYMNQPIVKLTLQPLVENCIGHGLDYSIQKLNIDIKAFEQDNNLIIQIKDNGTGMDNKTIKSLLTTEPKTVDGKTKHIGVFATNQRLKLHFGAEYGLQFKQNPERGTIVEIKLPREESI